MDIREIKLAEAVCLQGLQKTVFTSEAWLKTFAREVRAYGVYDGAELMAVFSLQHEKRYGVRILTTPSLAPHCGLVVREIDGNAARRNGICKEVMTALAQFFDKPLCAVVSVIFPDWIKDFQPFAWRGFKVLVRYTYQIQLAGKSEDDFLKEMNPTRRNEIRNGHKKGLTVEAGTGPSVVESLARTTFKRQGVSADMGRIRLLLHEFAEPANSFGYVVRRDNEPVAACFCIHDTERAYYVLGGVEPERGAAPAAPLALFSCIKHARELGMKVFDFEGSMVPGIEQYFRSFGGELTPLCRVVKAGLPIEMCLKPFKRALF